MTDDDRELFRRAMAGAKPVSGNERAPGRKRRRAAANARSARADELLVLRESLSADVDWIDSENGDGLRFARPSVGKRTLRKLARGGFSVQAEIDLHGMTVAEAKPRLAEFVAQCAADGRLCIRVIHGKGRGSGSRGPVLKQSVDRWLRQWDAVLAFVTARPVDGGSGATYVLLARR